MAEASIQSYRDLKVWQMSRELASEVYLLTNHFPPDEKFGLISQLRRAAISIASNIAEGHGRRLPKAFNHHLSIARGSASEVETQIIIAADLQFIDVTRIEAPLAKLDEISRMITGLQRSLENKINRG
jgi:four helix bundle protein